MSYGFPSIAALKSLTSDDVTDALAVIRKDDRDHLVGAKGRAGVYNFEKDAVSLAFKFTDEDGARSHVMNTELFQFFNMPIVPCRAFGLGKEFNASQFFTQTGHLPDTQQEMTHVVVMPFVKGRNLETVLEKKNPDDDFSLALLNKNILHYATPICLSYHWDCLPKNIIVDTAQDRLDPNGFTFIDAEHALLSDKGLNIINSPLATLEYKYLPKDQNAAVLLKEKLYENMLTTCLYWDKQIKDSPSVTSYEKTNDLKEALLFRNRLLKAHLTNE